MHKNIKSVQEKTKGAFELMREAFAYKNPMQTPKIEKVVVSVGFGSIKDKDKKKIDLIADRLSKITGQKPASRAAKKSIASFKLREGEPIGYQVTLRGPRMVGFLDKLLNIALPRTRDWRGIQTKAIDEIGNLTIGIKEHTIFPETSDEELKDVFGMAITVVTAAKSKEEAKAFLTHLGFPFRK